jgi:hypothetical protein
MLRRAACRDVAHLGKSCQICSRAMAKDNPQRRASLQVQPQHVEREVFACCNNSWSARAAQQSSGLLRIARIAAASGGREERG